MPELLSFLESLQLALAALALPLAVLFIRHRRDVTEPGFGWVGASFALYLVNHVGSTLLGFQGQQVLGVGWFTLASASTALGAMLVGYRLHSGVVSRSCLTRPFTLFVSASALTAALIVSIWPIAPVGVHGVPAVILGYSAWLQYRQYRRYPGAGYGETALALAAHPAGWVALVLLRTGPDVVQDLLSIPFVAAGIAVLSVGLRRSHRDLDRVVAERTEQLRAANDELRALSLKDPLTGLGNRRRLDDFLAHETSRHARFRLPLSVILLDVDHFKDFNDRYGHVEGDECLRRVARCLTDVIKRKDDLVARYGGEEFAIVLPGIGHDIALRLAEAIRSRVADERIEHLGSPVAVHVTASLGVVTTVPMAGTFPSALIDAADAALYLAKRRGRDRVESYFSQAAVVARVSSSDMAPALAGDSRELSWVRSAENDGEDAGVMALSSGPCRDDAQPAVAVS